MQFHGIVRCRRRRCLDCSNGPCTPRHSRLSGLSRSNLREAEGTWCSPGVPAVESCVFDSSRRRPAAHVEPRDGPGNAAWGRIRTADDLSRVPDRDSHLLEILERTTQQDCRRTLVILERNRALRSDVYGRSRPPSVTARFEQRHPGIARVLWIIAPRAWIPRTYAITTGIPAATRSGDLATASAAEAIDIHAMTVASRDEEYLPWSGIAAAAPALARVCDLVLHLGSNPRLIEVDLAPYRDPLFRAEWSRRAKLRDAVDGSDECLRRIERRIECAAIAPSPVISTSAPKEGISCSLELERSVVFRGEPIVLELTLRNEGSKPQTIPTQNLFTSGAKLRRDGSVLPHLGGYACGGPIPTRTLEPGGSYRMSGEVSTAFDCSAPGHYEFVYPHLLRTVLLAPSEILRPKPVEFLVLPEPEAGSSRQRTSPIDRDGDWR